MYRVHRLMGRTDMKRTFTSLVLGIALLVEGGGVGLAQDIDAGAVAFERGDYANAFREWGMLAAKGNSAAQYNLGQMYYQSQGVARDYKKAVHWFRQSAEQGDADAQYNLGVMLAKGQGVTQDYVYAHMWWNIAASNGYADAAEVKDGLEKFMMTEQIARAQELARQCVSKNYKGC